MDMTFKILVTLLYVAFSIAVLSFALRVLFVGFRLWRSPPQEYDYNRFLLGNWRDALRGRSNVHLETPDLTHGFVLSAASPYAPIRNSTLSEHRVRAVLRSR